MRISALEAFGVDCRILDAWAGGGRQELLPIQLLAVRKGRVLEGGNAVIFSPTSSGKTFVGEMAAVRTARRNRRVMYLVPQKALAEEKYREFRGQYGRFGVRVVISTRERREHDRAIHRGEFHIAVVVFEKFQALMVSNPALLRNVGLVVIDELQMIGDKARGPGLEVLLTKILLAESQPQVIGLSAVLGNAEGLARWLGATLCEDCKRPVELRKGVLYGGRFRYVEHNSGREGVERFPGPSEEGEPGLDVLVREARRLVRQGEQCLVFCKSREESVKTAKEMAGVLGPKPARRALEELGHLEDSRGKDILTGLLSCGVAYHNADLDWDQRDVIERWFRRGEISVICTTTTLALGMNLPARNVFIDPERWDRDRTGRWVRVPITQAEYENTSGRAGRLGLEDEFGRAILIAASEFEADTFFDSFVRGSLGNVEPTLDSAPLAQHVLSLAASKLCRTKEEIRDVLLASYTGWTRWRGDGKEEAFVARLEGAVAQCLEGELMTERRGELKVTPLGRLTAAKGIRVETATEMAAFVRDHADIAPAVHPFEVLWCLTGTEDGRAIYFNLAREEYRSGEYQPLLAATLRGLPRAAQRRMADQRADSLLGYESVKRAKKAMLLHEWVEGTPTRHVESQFHCFSGSIGGMAGEFAWLAETLAGIAKILGWPEEAVAQVTTLSQQLLHGVPQEGVGLAKVRVRGLGRGRIAELVRKGLDTLERIVTAPLKELQKLLTAPVADAVLRKARETADVRDAADAAEPDAFDDVTGQPPDSPAYTTWPEEYPPSDDTGAAYQSDAAIHIDSRARRRRHLVKVNGEEAWLTEQSFQVALRLAVTAKTTALGWVGCPDIGDHDTYHQVIRRLKKDLEAGGVDPEKLVENNRAKQYRFSVPPANVTIDQGMVERHFAEGKRILAGLPPSPPHHA